MDTGKRVWFVGVVLTGLILAGCAGDWTTYTPSAREWSNGAQATIEGVDVERIGTLSALDVQEKQIHLDATAQAAIVAVTVEAFRARAEVDRMAATRQAAAATSSAWDRNVQGTTAANDRHLQATEQASRATAEAAAVAQATVEARAVVATMEARSVEGTRQAMALEGTRARQTWEQDATATAWAVGYQATAQVEYDARRASATAEVIRATRNSHQATATRAAEQREMTLGAARDFGLPMLGLALIIACIIGGVWLARELMNRPHTMQRSLLGDAEPVMFKQRDGSYTLIDLDRQPSAALRLLPGGEVEAPQLRSAGQEERTTARDQALDGVSRPRMGGGHSAQPAVQMAEPPSAAMEGLQGVRILRTLSQAGTAGLLPPGQVEAIEAVWAEED